MRLFLYLPFQCVQELLKSPLINSEQVDNYGLTAAEWAEQVQQKKCAKLIRESVAKKSSTLPVCLSVCLFSVLSFFVQYYIYSVGYIIEQIILFNHLFCNVYLSY